MDHKKFISRKTGVALILTVLALRSVKSQEEFTVDCSEISNPVLAVYGTSLVLGPIRFTYKFDDNLDDHTLIYTFNQTHQQERGNWVQLLQPQLLIRCVFPHELQDTENVRAISCAGLYHQTIGRYHLALLYGYGGADSTLTMNVNIDVYDTAKYQIYLTIGNITKSCPPDDQLELTVTDYDLQANNSSRDVALITITCSVLVMVILFVILVVNRKAWAWFRSKDADLAAKQLGIDGINKNDKLLGNAVKLTSQESKPDIGEKEMTLEEAIARTQMTAMMKAAVDESKTNKLEAAKSGNKVNWEIMRKVIMDATPLSAEKQIHLKKMIERERRRSTLRKERLPDPDQIYSSLRKQDNFTSATSLLTQLTLAKLVD